MLTARRFMVLARIGLVVAVSLAGALVLDGHGIARMIQHGAPQILAAHAWDKPSRVVAFYGLGLLAFAAFPRSRRDDLTLALIFFGASLEMVQTVFGRPFQLPNLLADAAGIWALRAPAPLEGLRKAMREQPSSPAFQARTAHDLATPPLANRRGPSRGFCVLSAWIIASGIVFATLGPQSLRPHVADAQVERFCAYFLMGSAFVIAYPRRWATIALAITATAVGLELAQLVVPGRDAGAPDAIAKALGGLAGVALVRLGQGMGRGARRASRSEPRHNVPAAAG